MHTLNVRTDLREQLNGSIGIVLKGNTRTGTEAGNEASDSYSSSRPNRGR